MSKAVIEKVVNDFIGNKAPGVLAVTGPWGVGKTFMLRNMIAKYRGTDGLRKYAYASAFGVQTIPEIRTMLLAKTRKLPFEDHSTRGVRGRVEEEAARRNLGAAFKALKEMLPWGGKHLVVALEAVAGSLIADTVVVLDDLERLGGKLTIQEVMGLASDLKEQARCKVILIFNHDQLDAVALDAYERLAEKVVDQKLDFVLEVSDAIDIGLATDTPMREMLVAPLRSLEVSNIRVIKKVEAAARMLAETIGTRSHRVQQQAATTIAVIACSLYERSRGFPPPEELARYNRFTHRMARDEANRQNAEAAQMWISKLEACNYSSTDDFDKAVLEAMRRGYIEGTDVATQALALDAVVDREQLERIFSDAWNLFQQSFDVDAEQVAAALLNAVTQCAIVISPLNLNSTVKLLRELGFDDRADEALETYITARRGKPEIFDLNQVARMGDIDDPKTRARFAEEFSGARPSMTLQQAADMIIQNTEWHDGIPAALDSATIEQIVALVLTHQGPHLRHLVTGISRIPVPADERESIRLKMVEALQVIGRRSAINRMRIERLGILMDA